MTSSTEGQAPAPLLRRVHGALADRSPARPLAATIRPLIRGKTPAIAAPAIPAVEGTR